MPRLTDFGLRSPWDLSGGEDRVEVMLQRFIYETSPRQVRHATIGPGTAPGTLLLNIQFDPGQIYRLEISEGLAAHAFGSVEVGNVRIHGTLAMDYDRMSERWVIGPAPRPAPLITGPGPAAPLAAPSDDSLLLPDGMVETLPPEVLELIRGLRAANRSKQETINRCREDARLMDLRVERAQRRAEQQRLIAAQATEKLDLLNRLHETALVWRDHGAGAEAQRDAFKNFCEALDSLPAPAETPPPDFALAG